MERLGRETQEDERKQASSRNLKKQRNAGNGDEEQRVRAAEGQSSCM